VGAGVSIAGLLRAMPSNSLGRYGDALEVSRRAFASSNSRST
jgi:hypothetical protein